MKEKLNKVIKYLYRKINKVIKYLYRKITGKKIIVLDEGHLIMKNHMKNTDELRNIREYGMRKRGGNENFEKLALLEANSQRVLTKEERDKELIQLRRINENNISL